MESGSERMDGMWAWLEEHSRWSKLRELGQSNLVRASVLMPVFGYLLLLNEHVHQYLSIKYDAVWPYSYLPSMWRVWMLYYGSFLLAIGSLLFTWKCPTEVKQHATAFKMAEAERPHLTAHNLFDQIIDKLKDLYEGMSKWENTAFKMPRLKPDEPNLGAGTSSDLRTGDQWGLGLIHIWMIADIKWPTLRIAIYLLFSAGLALLAVPALFTLVQVTLLFVKHVVT